MRCPTNRPTSSVRNRQRNEGGWTGQRAACGRKENFQQWLHKLHPKVHTKERFASRKYRRTFFIRFLRTNRKVVRLNKQTSIWRHWRITKTARTSIKEPNDKRGLVGKIQTWHQFSFWGICVGDWESEKLGNAVTGSLTGREALAVPQSRGLQGDAGVQPQSACFLRKQPRSSTGILKSFDLRERVLWK